MLKCFLPTAATALALAMSVWLAIATLGLVKSQEGIHAKEQEIQAIQSKIQVLQQQLQAQQQQVDTSNQLANQVGPAILKDLVDLQAKNGNIALAVFLQKHGVEFGKQ